MHVCIKYGDVVYIQPDTEVTPAGFVSDLESVGLAACPRPREHFSVVR